MGDTVDENSPPNNTKSTTNDDTQSIDDERPSLNKNKEIQKKKNNAKLNWKRRLVWPCQTKQQISPTQQLVCTESSRLLKPTRWPRLLPRPQKRELARSSSVLVFKNHRENKKKRKKKPPSVMENYTGLVPHVADL